MRERIARHRADRDARWSTIEAPRELPAAIDALNGADAVVLVDCLTLWVSNLMLAGTDMSCAGGKLRDAIESLDSTLIIVANKVGMGTVPEHALARRV